MDLELRRKRIETGGKIAVALVAGFFVAPFIFIAIKGLIGLALAGVVSVVLVNFGPWFAMKLANWRLKAIKAEASKNPIETMENEYRTRQEKLIEFKEHIRTFFASTKSFHEKLQGFKDKFPQDTKQFEDQYSQMVQLLELRKQKYREAQAGLAQYENVIQRARAIWAMSQEAAAMRNAAGVDVDEFYSKLKVETALESVQLSMNTAFADLELALMDEQKQPIRAIAAMSQPMPSKGPPTLELELDPVPILAGKHK